MTSAELNMRIFERMLDAYGPRGWWPARTRFEVIAGAILTQNVSWKNARNAVLGLKKAGMLSPGALLGATREEIAAKIKTSRFYFQKADKLKVFCRHLADGYEGSLDKFFKTEAGLLRRELLALRGIGPETADCILLYAGKKLSFVSDAYTARFLDRYGILKGAGYDEIRKYFMDNLPEDLYLYNEFHALIVHHGNSVCRAKPLCLECPVRTLERGTRCAMPAGAGIHRKADA